MWIFGYGSIIWKPDFAYVERRPGYIEGWARRFYQHSIDHRGVPELPGRVVTVLPADEEICWGVAYRVGSEERGEVIEQLDRRETAGYERHEVEVQTPEGEETIDPAVMYVASRDNPHFAGPASAEAVAERVLRAEGPSGDNVDYVLKLARALREIDAEDPHVFEVEREVRRRMEEGSEA